MGNHVHSGIKLSLKPTLRMGVDVEYLGHGYRQPSVCLNVERLRTVSVRRRYVRPTFIIILDVYSSGILNKLGCYLARPGKGYARQVPVRPYPNRSIAIDHATPKMRVIDYAHTSLLSEAFSRDHTKLFEVIHEFFGKNRKMYRTKLFIRAGRALHLMMDFVAGLYERSKLLKVGEVFNRKSDLQKSSIGHAPIRNEKPSPIGRRRSDSFEGRLVNRDSSGGSFPSVSSPLRYTPNTRNSYSKFLGQFCLAFPRDHTARDGRFLFFGECSHARIMAHVAIDINSVLF